MGLGFTTMTFSKCLYLLSSQGQPNIETGWRVDITASTAHPAVAALEQLSLQTCLGLWAQALVGAAITRASIRNKSYLRADWLDSRPGMRKCKMRIQCNIL